MARLSPLVLAALLIVGSLAGGDAFAQGGGASVGSINGKVTDPSGSVLPGVNVQARSASMMGLQTSVTDAGGNYRFPALPPGAYTVLYELPGFKTVERGNIQIAVGFNATVNVELDVATLVETVTVSGASPVIDTSSTRVQQTFSLEKMAEIPNARDMWSLIAVTPSVTMSRTDVGGSQAGIQSDYRAYGFSGQRQVILEGINITYDAGLSQLYPDYGSLEEVSIGTISHGAEVAGPGVQTRMLTKSGGNRFQGELYQDYAGSGMQSSNIPDDVLAKGIRAGSNETDRNRNFSANIGGPVKTDRLWWHFSYHNQKITIGQPNFVGPIAGVMFDSYLKNYSGKGTVQLNQQHKVIGYMSRNQKEQPFYQISAAFTYTDLGQTTNRSNDVLVYKGEWNGTLTNNMYAEAVLGGSNLSSANLANTDTTDFYVVDAGRGTYSGGERKRQYTPQRKQITGSINYFKSGWGGTHTIKVGGGIQPELRNDGYTQQASGNVRQNLNNGVPVSVILYAPTARKVSKVAADVSDGDLTTQDRLDVASAFVTDQWSLGRTTLNLGMRWDRYRAWSPDQVQLPYSFGPLNIQDVSFPEVSYFTWNRVVPRLGFIYDLTGDGRTVLKLNYGTYAFDPGISLGGFANPNQLVKSVTYAWTDSRTCAGCVAGDGTYQPGEEGNQTASSLAGNVQVARDLEQPTSTQATAYLERQLTDDLGTRVGFVYYTVRDQVAQFQPFRPASAYTVPFTVVDRGADNVLGSADDANLTLFGIPNSEIGKYPNTAVVSNTPNDGTYKTVELSLDKRRSHNYSAGLGVSYSWLNEFPSGFPNTPNGPFAYDHRMASVKANGSYMFPHGFMVSGTYRFQAGPNYARTLSVAAPASCACTFSAAGTANLGNTLVFTTPFNEYSQDNVSVVDLRVEKTLELGSILRLRVFFDAFNITNRYAAETINVATGPNFQTPTAILAPRMGRIGARLTW